MVTETNSRTDRAKHILMHTLITTLISLEKSAWVLGKQSSYMSGTCEEAIDECC